MDARETEKLFALLGCYYPNAKQLKSKPMQAAWVIALEPFAYEDVKAAAVAYVRKKNFFPDVADLTAGLVSSNETQASNDAVDQMQADAWAWVEKLDQAKKPTAESLSDDAWGYV